MYVVEAARSKHTVETLAAETAAPTTGKTAVQSIHACMCVSPSASCVAGLATHPSTTPPATGGTCGSRGGYKITARSRHRSHRIQGWVGV